MELRRSRKSGLVRFKNWRGVEQSAAGTEMSRIRPLWAQAATGILVVYLILSTIAIWGWVGFGAYAGIWHNGGAEYCDYNDVPPGYTNIINGQACMVNWGYVIGTHGYLIIVLSLILQSPAFGAVWWIRRRYPLGRGAPP